MIFFKAFLLIISLIAIPCIPGFLGMQFFHIKEEKAFSRFLWAWLLGSLFSWALFQLVSVPLIFMRQKLSIAIFLWLSLLLLLSLFFFLSAKNQRNAKASFSFSRAAQAFGKENKSIKAASANRTKEGRLFEKLCLLLLLLAGILIIGFQCYHYIFMMHTDADDSRFIASAVDAVRRDYMLIVTPATDLQQQRKSGKPPC